MPTLVSQTPIVRTRGDDVDDLIIRFKIADGTAADLTGYTIASAAIKWRGGAVDLSTGSRLVPDWPNGELAFDLAAADWTSVPEGQRSRLVIQIANADGSKNTKLIKPWKVIVP